MPLCSAENHSLSEPSIFCNGGSKVTCTFRAMVLPRSSSTTCRSMALSGIRSDISRDVGLGLIAPHPLLHLVLPTRRCHLFSCRCNGVTGRGRLHLGAHGGLLRAPGLPESKQNADYRYPDGDDRHDDLSAHRVGSLLVDGRAVARSLQGRVPATSWRACSLFVLSGRL